MNPSPSILRQRGASLFTALIMLVAMSLVSLASLTTSLMELRMASNAEASVSAFEAAQAAIDVSVSGATDYYVVAGSVGHTRCFNLSGCVETQDSMPAPIGPKHELRITRVTESGCPPRTRDHATSCAKQNAATFVAEARFDGTLQGEGRAELVQGYIRLIPINPGAVSTPVVVSVQN